VLSSHTKRSSSRVAALLRLAAVITGRSDTALGALHRRLAARAGKAKAVTATARKIAGRIYNTLRHGMTYRDAGASHYEEQYRNRVLSNLKRRAKSFGYDLQELPEKVDMAVSLESHRVFRARVSVRCAFIEAQRAEFSMRSMCRVLMAHFGGFRAWLREPLSQRAQEDVCQTDLIRQARADSGKVLDIANCMMIGAIKVRPA